ncbi:hypothetical protein JYU34_022394 [Plutella xylostella]|uniref:Uncharacterized protein n=1 Tax=Plutella xylostella TaxID=51655 RepID=A0ABQ7PR33_PLUXY|nr:hypothetical protein JYU34_022394 [Plutella xylostella]
MAKTTVRIYCKFSRYELLAGYSLSFKENVLRNVIGTNLRPPLLFIVVPELRNEPHMDSPTFYDCEDASTGFPHQELTPGAPNEEPASAMGAGPTATAACAGHAAPAARAVDEGSSVDTTAPGAAMPPGPSQW